MPGREMRVLGDSGEDSPHRSHSASSVVTALSRSLEAESDRLSLWVPVLLAGGILISHFQMSPRLGFDSRPAEPGSA